MLNNIVICFVQGIKYLVDEGLLVETPDEIAKFLYSDGLNKTAIGDYLGDMYVFSFYVDQCITVCTPVSQ